MQMQLQIKLFYDARTQNLGDRCICTFNDLGMFKGHLCGGLLVLRQDLVIFGQLHLVQLAAPSPEHPHDTNHHKLRTAPNGTHELK